VCVYINIGIYIYISTCMYIYISIHLSIYLYTCMCACICIYIYTYVYLHTYLRIYIYICTYIYVRQLYEIWDESNVSQIFIGVRLSVRNPNWFPWNFWVRSCERDKTDSHNGRETERGRRDARKKRGLNSGKEYRRAIERRVVELRERCRRGAAGISVAHTHTYTHTNLGAMHLCDRFNPLFEILYVRETIAWGESWLHCKAQTHDCSQAFSRLSCFLTLNKIIVHHSGNISLVIGLCLYEVLFLSWLHTHIHAYICVFVCVHVHVQVYMHINTHTHTHKSIYMYMKILINIYLYMYMYM